MGHPPEEMWRDASREDIQAPVQQAWGMQAQIGRWVTIAGGKPVKPGGRAMKGQTDECLMERYADGDADAFGELFGRYERRAYRFFAARIRSEERAWDLYQDLFLRLHRFRRTYRAGGPFAPWFFQIARRVLLDDLRRDRSSREVPLESEIARSEENDAERRVADVEQAEELLSRLSPEQGLVLLAEKVEGLGCAEIAAHLGKSVAAVKQVASRGLRKLRTVEGFAA